MSQERLKKFTILHSNDMHGDFLAESQGAQGNLIGGLALLSGYIQKVRREEKNTLYLIAGDMVQGSMIDTEYKGVSTMEIMNFMAPDVVTLGNHELDYGLPHLLFLEKMANFPIVNANLYIKQYHKRLMNPYIILNVDGFDIMFIGIITESATNKLKSSDVGTFVGLQEASEEVRKICDAYKSSDIDLTILLTHIGFEEDKKLAAMLDPALGVDMIIGGHSHTLLEKPEVVNNIIITQAGTGTDQIGRFDIVVDDDTNSIVEWKWKLVPINKDLAAPDEALQKYIDSYKEVVDRKYNRILCRLAQKLTHPVRYEETALGNLFVDIFADRSESDLMILGSAAVRGTEMGPVVTLGDLLKVYPYDSSLHKFSVKGSLIRKIFEHILAPEGRHDDGPVCQVSANVRVVYNDTQRKVTSLALKGQPVQDDGHYTLCLSDYHFKNSENSFNVKKEELTELGNPQTVATSTQNLLEEYLSAHQNLNCQIEGRMVIEK